MPTIRKRSSAAPSRSWDNTAAIFRACRWLNCFEFFVFDEQGDDPPAPRVSDEILFFGFRPGLTGIRFY
jgi:hypothetical protein